jgi:hypothetical protein
LSLPKQLGVTHSTFTVALSIALRGTWTRHAKTTAHVSYLKAPSLQFSNLNLKEGEAKGLS